MSRSSTLILLGILTLLTPLSGLPVAFRSFLTMLFGASILGIGLAMRTRTQREFETTAAAEPTPPTTPTGVSPI